MDIKSFTNWEGQGGRQGALSVQKNEKITRTVPILKSNSNNFYLDFFFMTGGGGVGGRGRSEFFWQNHFFFIIISPMQ